MDRECLFVRLLLVVRLWLTSRTAFYENQQNQQTQTVESPAVKTIDFPKVAKPPFTLAESFANSPRRSNLAKAGGDTLPNGTSSYEIGFPS